MAGDRDGVDMRVGWPPTVHAGSLQVGVGRTVITPDPLLPVSGGLGPTGSGERDNVAS